MRLFYFLMLGLAGASSAFAAHTNIVVVGTNGSFSPSRMDIFSGDTVIWQFPSRNDNIIPVNFNPSPSVLCTNYKAYTPTDTNEFTGPMPRAVSGIFSLSPEDSPYASKTNTWQSTNLVGVFIRPRWDQVQLGPNEWDWHEVDQEIDQAVQHGKVYSLGFKAGASGTPRWLFTNGVVPVDFGFKTFSLKTNLNGTVSTNSVKNYIGSPSDPKYYFYWSNLLVSAANHLLVRNDRYRALAYIKVGGFNLHTHENRLPAEASDLPIWATNRYTPTNLYVFYSNEFALLAEKFPDKDMSYALIQDGFPRVNEFGEYAWQSATTNHALPGGTEQTEAVLAMGRTNWGQRFMVQHNGLGPKTTNSFDCPTAGMHPITTTSNDLPSAQALGCPNAWVLNESARGQITGFQTGNVDSVSNLLTLEDTLDNARQNSDAIFVEIYEEASTLAESTNLPAGETLGDWNDGFNHRRRLWYQSIPDPFPTNHLHKFIRTETNASAVQLFYYVDAARNAANGGTNFGVIAVHPDFSFTSIVKTNSQIVFTLGIANPGTNSIETSTTLTNWQVWQTGITNTGFLNFIDPTPTAPKKYYRAKRTAP